jgi:hypothetical protein
MAFEEPMAAFFGVDDFAVTAMLAGVYVTGIFDANYYEPLGEVEGRQPVFMLPTSEAKYAAHGQYLAIGNTRYRVRGVHPDGTGVTTLILEQQ